MRIIILSAFPRLDRHGYKKTILTGLQGKPYFSPDDTALVYGQTRLRDYRREVTKFGLADSVGKARILLGRREPGEATTVESVSSPGTVGSVARSAGIEVREFGRFGDARCLTWVRGFRADVIVNVSGQYIPRDLLTMPHVGVVGPHYALLPAVRGGDTVRWSILLDVPMYVSHMVLAPEMDMGDVLRREAVAVKRGDTVEDIYAACRTASARGILEILDQVYADGLRPEVQKKSDGRLFYRMGKHLKAKVDARLAAKEYAHYA